MKSLLYISFLIAFMVSGCTKKFDEINTDPTKSSPASFDANYFLSSSQWEYANAISGYSGPILFESGWAQIFASTSSGSANYYSNGDKYVPSTNTNEYLASTWNRAYRSSSLANEMVTLTQNKPEWSNVKNVAIIMKVLNAQTLTDTYGDIPYSQALKAKEGITQPVYDKQQDVYKSMLSDLDAAVTALDAAKALPSADLFPYKGNIAKWKKFGYSLMVRIAMRLTKADPAMAKTYTEKAAAGGTFASVADDAYILSNEANGYRNANAAALMVAGDFYEVRWSKTLIDYFRRNNDPRLGIIGEVPNDGLIANQNTGLAGSTDSAKQSGMPNGYDLGGGATDISKSPGYPGGTGTGADFTPIGKYSRPRTLLYGNYNGPIFVITYAETELLLAEAAVRGWSVGATAAAHYANGVAGALQSLAVINAAATVTPAAAMAYAAAHPLDVSTQANSYKMINEQYWATDASLLNFSEAWNNWKRSGYPVLTPLNYAGNFSSGEIPRRQPYPTTEATLNGANYAIGVSSLNKGDKWNSRVWWDK